MLSEEIFSRTFFLPKTQKKLLHCSCVLLSWCCVIFSPPVPKSPGGGPKLSCLLVGVLVMQVVNAMHAEHHLPVCVPLCRLVNDLAFCLSLIRRAYAFTFSGDWRDLILWSSFFTPPPRNLQRQVAMVYVVPPHNEGGARGTGGSRGRTGFFPSSLCLYKRVTMPWEGG